MAHVLAELAGAVGTVTLDHERRRNALSHALVEEVLAAMQSFREAKARVVILRARRGAKVFSAGHDVDELPQTRRDPLGWDDPLRRLVREIEGFPGPVIAMVEGSVWGGATETVFACDLIVAAAESATFAVTPAGPFTMKGKSVPLLVHEVGEETGTREATDSARLPFLGRDAEVGIVAEALSHALGGEGGVVVLDGATGMGKSRLVHEALAAAPDATVTVLRGEPYGLPRGPNKVFEPILRRLRPVASGHPSCTGCAPSASPAGPS